MAWAPVLQKVGRDSLAPDGQSAWWRSRFRLRAVRDACGREAQDAGGAPVHDVPALLEAAKDTILTTGALVLALDSFLRVGGRPGRHPDNRFSGVAVWCR